MAPLCVSLPPFTPFPPPVLAHSHSHVHAPHHRREWQQFAGDLATAERAAALADGGFAFAFVEGALIEALRCGHWLLLDEINLAPPEVLERIAGLLEGAGTGSITLLERGDTTQVRRGGYHVWG